MSETTGNAPISSPAGIGQNNQVMPIANDMTDENQIMQRESSQEVLLHQENGIGLPVPAESKIKKKSTMSMSMAMSDCCPKEQSKFSNSADDTYDYLLKLMNHEVTSYGLFKFDISYLGGFIYFGEIDKKDPDHLLFHKGDESPQILQIPLMKDKSMENMDNKDVLYEPNQIGSFRRFQVQYFKQWKDNYVLVRQKSRLQVFERKFSVSKSTLEPCEGANFKLNLDDSKSNSACQLHISTDQEILFIKDYQKDDQDKNKVLKSKMYKLKFDFDTMRFSCLLEQTYDQGELTIYKGVNQLDKLILCFNDGDINFFKVVRMNDLVEEKQVDLKYKPSTLEVCDKGDFIFIGFTNGYIQQWSIRELDEIKMEQEFYFHEKKITSLTHHDCIYLISGSQFSEQEGHISIWSLKTGKRVGMVDVPGTIRNIFIMPNMDMIALSNMGVYVIEDVKIKGYTDIPRRKDNLKITSSNVFFLANDEKFVAGYDKTIVIIDSFKNYIGQSNRVKEIRYDLEDQDRIILFIFAEEKQNYYYINTAKRGGEGWYEGSIIKLKLVDEKLTKILEYNFPQQTKDKKNQYHKKFHLMQERENKTKIISSGPHGIMIYDDDGTILKSIEAQTTREFTGQMVDAKYFPQLNAIIGGSMDGIIKFYNKDTLAEITVDSGKKSSDQVKKPLQLRAYDPNIEMQKRFQYYSKLAFSRSGLKQHLQYIAQGNEHGQIFIWRIQDIKKDLPCQVIKYAGQVYDCKFIQEESQNINILISLHAKCKKNNTSNRIIFTSLKDFQVIDMLNLQFEARSVNIHPNQKQIYVIAVDQKSKGQWMTFDLGFEKKELSKYKQNMRNQNLKSFHDGNIKIFQDILKPDHKMGSFDILHSMNLFHLCAINPDFSFCANDPEISLFHEMKYLNIQYMKDANNLAPADYLLQKDNMKGMKELFKLFRGVMLHDKKITLDLDKCLLFHGLSKEQEWLQESQEEIMMEPKSWDGIRIPIFGEFKQNYFIKQIDWFTNNQMSQHIFLSGSRYIDTAQIEEFIDLKSDNKQEIQIEVLKVPMNLEIGSQSSIDFLTELGSLLDESFYSKFKIVVDYKWEIDQLYVILHAVIFAIFALMIDFEALYNLEFRMDSPNYKAYGLLYGIMALSIIFILFEFLQMYFQGWDYLDFKNFLDLIGTPSLLVYCFYKLNLQYPWTEDEEQAMQVLISLGSFLVNFRLLYHLTVFSTKLRQIMKVINESMWDLKQFAFMMYFFIFIISISQYVLQDQVPAKRNSFDKIFADQYNILYIGTVEDLYKMRLSAQILYVVETNFLIIICLNILISVVTDKYDLIMERMDAIDCQSRAKLMLEIECLMKWKRNSGYEQYVMFAHYGGSFNDEVDVQEGKFRMLKKQIMNAEVSLGQKVKSLEQKLDLLLAKNGINQPDDQKEKK